MAEQKKPRSKGKRFNWKRMRKKFKKKMKNEKKEKRYRR
jgi:hypothetical protein